MEAHPTQEKLTVHVKPGEAQLAEGIPLRHVTVGDGIEAGYEGAKLGPGYRGRDEVALLRNEEVGLMADEVGIGTQIAES